MGNYLRSEYTRHNELLVLGQQPSPDDLHMICTQLASPHDSRWGRKSALTLPPGFGISTQAHGIFRTSYKGILSFLSLTRARKLGIRETCQNFST